MMINPKKLKDYGLLSVLKWLEMNLWDLYCSNLNNLLILSGLFFYFKLVKEWFIHRGQWILLKIMIWLQRSSTLRALYEVMLVVEEIYFEGSILLWSNEFIKVLWKLLRNWNPKTLPSSTRNLLCLHFSAFACSEINLGQGITVFFTH